MHCTSSSMSVSSVNRRRHGLLLEPLISKLCHPKLQPNKTGTTFFGKDFQDLNDAGQFPRTCLSAETQRNAWMKTRS